MRKRIVRQVIAMVLCVCMALGLFDGIPVVKEYVRTSTEAEAADGNTLASVAESEYNSHRGKNGNGWYGAGAWCCHFVNWCARNAGISTNVVPSTASCTDMYNKILRTGANIVANPKRGDLCFYKLTRTGGFCHIGIMTDSTYSIQGNIYVAGRSTWYKLRPREYRAVNNQPYTIVYVRPNYQTSINYQITTCGVTNISNNDARILGSMSPAGNVNSWGFYVGANTGAMAKITVSGQTYSGNMGCNIVNYYKLNYGTTYYYKIWAVVNGQEKQGGIVSFRTTATKPEIPSLKIASNYQNIGLESSATVNWNATRNTKYYKAYLYNSDNELIETSGQVTGTKYAFKAAQKVGTYHAKVEAYNEVGTKGQSNEVSFTVHPDVTVTFVDADSFVDVPVGTEPVELGKQTIHYGGTANAPADPEHHRIYI